MIAIVEGLTEYYFYFEYNMELVKMMQNFKSSRWNYELKVWIVNKKHTSPEQIHSVLKHYGIKYEILPYEEQVIRHVNVTDLNGKWEVELKRYKDFLTLRGYSIKTKKNYYDHMRRIIFYSIERDLDLSEETLKQYLLESFDVKDCSKSYVSQAISAYKIFMKGYGVNQCLKDLPRPKRKQQLPKVLSQAETIRILQAPSNLKHRALLFLIYASGLRVSEAATLKVSDIEADRMLLRVEHAKGDKDRYTLLSETALEVLKTYMQLHRPKYWLFEGQQPESHISERSIQHIFKQALLKAEVDKDVGIHVMRHSFATHLLEGGTDIRYIQAMLGHQSPKTTQIYTHVTDKRLAKIKSPLDMIDVKAPSGNKK